MIEFFAHLSAAPEPPRAGADSVTEPTIGTFTSVMALLSEPGERGKVIPADGQNLPESIVDLRLAKSRLPSPVAEDGPGEPIDAGTPVTGTPVTETPIVSAPAIGESVMTSVERLVTIMQGHDRPEPKQDQSQDVLQLTIKQSVIPAIVQGQYVLHTAQTREIPPPIVEQRLMEQRLMEQRPMEQGPMEQRSVRQRFLEPGLPEKEQLFSVGTRTQTSTQQVVAGPPVKPDQLIRPPIDDTPGRTVQSLTPVKETERSVLSQQPAAQQPIAQQPIAQQPAAQQPAANQPGAQQLGAKQTLVQIAGLAQAGVQQIGAAPGIQKTSIAQTGLQQLDVKQSVGPVQPLGTTPSMTETAVSRGALQTKVLPPVEQQGIPPIPSAPNLGRFVVREPVSESRLVRPEGQAPIQPSGQHAQRIVSHQQNPVALNIVEARDIPPGIPSATTPKLAVTGENATSADTKQGATTTEVHTPEMLDRLSKPLEKSIAIAGDRRDGQDIEKPTTLLNSQEHPRTNVMPEPSRFTPVFELGPNPMPPTEQGKVMLSVTQPVHQPGFPNEVAEKVVYLIKQDQQVAEIRLNPSSLGALEVRVHTEDDQAKVTFYAQSAATREMLESSLPRLREALLSVGVSLNDAEFSEHALGGRREEHSADTRQNFEPVEEEPIHYPAGHREGQEVGLVDTFI